ncbi:adenylyl-sulfate kinase [Streptomyces parvulus]|uniref:Adenylyl-sulfate kinase n=1 Tax=Streptomyces parvulus TaxID=146923 RepID=A0A369UTK2_9ACTN|nr:adenylyl-sulfate kinase [Streptomyces parvulus]RDD83831.1 adenylyl-sulfate kinase [Streptomyces parvulus]
MTTAHTPATGAATGAGGATVWLTGLPSAGKSTLARALARRLHAGARRVEVLDGDEIRAFLSAGLGFGRTDRHTNVQRIGFVAELLARNGVTALVPVIAPYADSRDAVRARHEANGTPCELTGLTGVDDPYEEPVAPELRIRTQGRTVAASAAELHTFLAERGLA